MTTRLGRGAPSSKSLREGTATRVRSVTTNTVRLASSANAGSSLWETHAWNFEWPTLLGLGVNTVAGIRNAELTGRYICFKDACSYVRKPLNRSRIFRTELPRGLDYGPVQFRELSNGEVRTSFSGPSSETASGVEMVPALVAIHETAEFELSLLSTLASHANKGESQDRPGGAAPSRSATTSSVLDAAYADSVREFKFPNEGFADESNLTAWLDDYVKFMRDFGTHFVSRVRTGARLVVKAVGDNMVLGNQALQKVQHILQGFHVDLTSDEIACIKFDVRGGPEMENIVKELERWWRRSLTAHLNNFGEEWISGTGLDQTLEADLMGQNVLVPVLNPDMKHPFQFAFDHISEGKFILYPQRRFVELYDAKGSHSRSCGSVYASRDAAAKKLSHVYPVADQVTRYLMVDLGHADEEDENHRRRLNFEVPGLYAHPHSRAFMYLVKPKALSLLYYESYTGSEFGRVNVYRMVPPDGYVAIGDVAIGYIGDSGLKEKGTGTHRSVIKACQKQILENYRCVHASCVTSACSYERVWTRDMIGNPTNGNKHHHLAFWSLRAQNGLDWVGFRAFRLTTDYRANMLKPSEDYVPYAGEDTVATTRELPEDRPAVPTVVLRGDRTLVPQLRPAVESEIRLRDKPSADKTEPSLDNENFEAIPYDRPR